MPRNRRDSAVCHRMRHSLTICHGRALCQHTMTSSCLCRLKETQVTSSKTKMVGRLPPRLRTFIWRTINGKWCDKLAGIRASRHQVNARDTFSGSDGDSIAPCVADATKTGDAGAAWLSRQNARWHACDKRCRVVVTCDLRLQVVTNCYNLGGLCQFLVNFKHQAAQAAQAAQPALQGKTFGSLSATPWHDQPTCQNCLRRTIRGNIWRNIWNPCIAHRFLPLETACDSVCWHLLWRGLHRMPWSFALVFPLHSACHL